MAEKIFGILMPKNARKCGGRGWLQYTINGIHQPKKVSLNPVKLQRPVQMPWDFFLKKNPNDGKEMGAHKTQFGGGPTASAALANRRIMQLFAQ